MTGQSKKPQPDENCEDHRLQTESAKEEGIGRAMTKHGFEQDSIMIHDPLFAPARMESQRKAALFAQAGAALNGAPACANKAAVQQDFPMPDFAPFEVVEGDSSRGLVLLADHARKDLPEEYGDLGLPPAAFSRHIAYDIGVEAVTRRLAARLGVPAVLGGFSRLLIDPNRGEDDPTLIMKLSDGAVIPANHPLDASERAARIRNFHRPYHDAVADTIAGVEAESAKAPLVISIHSFTPRWKETPRPWQVGILWDSDPRAVRPLIEALAADPDLTVGDNEPYDGALGGDTMFRHCTSEGLAHALIEIRQDLIADDAGAAEWAGRLAPILDDLNARPDLHVRKMHGSRTGLLRAGPDD